MSRISEIEGKSKKTEIYEKLKEILPKKGDEKIRYISKLKRGVEILRQLEKI